MAHSRSIWLAAAVSIASATLAAPSAQASFPGADGSIAFQATQIGSPEPLSIFSGPADGSGLTRLTTPPRGRRDSEPAYSADGRKIAFVRDGRLFVMSASGTGLRQVGFGFEPSFSPSGNHLVFTRTATCPSDHASVRVSIYKLTLAGGNPRRLTRSRGDQCNADTDPKWSPRGGRIVFSRNGDLRTIRTDGSQNRRIRVPGAPAFEPDWSPDGRRILFQRYQRNNFQASGIWAVGAGGGGLRLVYQDLTPGHVESDPVYSPSGASVAFALSLDGPRSAARVVTIPATGGVPTPVTPETYSASEPSWQPR
jgi:Tol biopolymer transport system component